MKSRPTLKSRLVAIVLTVVVATPVWSQTFSSSEVPQIISDHTTVTSTLTVPVGTGKVDGIQVQLTIVHTYIGDLRISLTSPQGNTVDLIHHPFSHSGLSGDYLFEDSAGTRIVDLLTLVIPAGSYHPTTAWDALSYLSDFQGETADGIWTLTIQDDFLWDEGILMAWSLILDATATPQSSTPLPSPRPAQADLLIGKSWSHLQGGGIIESRKAGERQTLVFTPRIFTTNRSKAHLLLANRGDRPAQLRLRSLGDRKPRMTVRVRSEGRNVSAAYAAGRFAPQVKGGGAVKVVYELETERFYAGVLRERRRDDVVRFRLSGAGKDHAALENRYHK